MLKQFLDMYYNQFKIEGESFDDFVNRITHIGIEIKDKDLYKSKVFQFLSELGASSQESKDIWEARQPMKFLSVTI